VPNQRQTKKDMIVEQLRILIETGEVARGSRIQQNELAARFSTSITPVREALKQLEAEGLLTGEPHRGVRVATAEPEEVKAIYIVRRLVEPYAFCRAARRVSRRELEQAEGLIELMAASAPGDRVQVGVTNRAFHFLFYERCGIRALTRQIEELWLGFPWDILQVLEGRVEQSVREHRRILAAVVAGDLAELGEAVESHIERSYLALADHLKSDPERDPFQLDVD
jgi:DNA-binding GntR family transcriptional regulator